MIAPWPGVEPATFRSRVRRRTAAPPGQPKLKTDVTLYTFRTFGTIIVKFTEKAEANL